MWTTCLVVATRSSGVPGLSRRSTHGITPQIDIAFLAMCTATARKISPSRRNKIAELGLTDAGCICQHALKTGSSSPGELEMTFSTSEVAVCWSSDSQSSVRWRSSLSSRVFSMAIDGLIGESLQQFFWIFGIGPGSAQPTTIAPSRSLPCSIGTPKSRRKPPGIEETAGRSSDRQVNPLCEPLFL